jgi:poly(3-hydroxybutyrate) depolymerase
MKTLRSSRRGYLWGIVVAGSLLAPPRVSAQIPEFERHSFTAQTGLTMPYRLVKPINRTTSRPYPLVLFLHGGGDVGTDNEKQLTWFPNCLTDSIAAHPCYIVVPQCPSLDIGWSSFPHFPDVATPPEPPLAIATVLELIDSIRASDSLTIDGNRVYVIGYSLGAEGTFDILTRRPQLFAAAIPISGIGDTAKAYLYKNVPLWIFHGTDDSINHVTYSRMIVAKLQSLGVTTKYSEYENMDHYITWKVYGEPDLVPWLFSQSRHGSNGVRLPREKRERGGVSYCAVRKGSRVDLSWKSAAVPEAVELYTLSGRMLHRYAVDGRGASPISLRIPFGQGALIIKIIKKGVTLHAALLPSK